MFARVTLFDATHRRRYERDLVTAKEDAQAETKLAKGQLFAEHETAELRDQFIAVLGHDLRNPLAAIDGGVNLLLREPQSEKSQKVLGLMRGSTLRMSGLIDNILDFARGRLGSGLALNRGVVALRPTLEQVVSEIRIAYPGRVIHIDIDPTITADVDPPRVAQMFSNLLANAVTHGADDHPISLKATINGDHLELSVANTGAPIPTDALPRLFQPFYRGTADSKVAGLGLGLYISSQIAQAHEGSLEVSSDDRETRFTFKMPLRSE